MLQMALCSDGMPSKGHKNFLTASQVARYCQVDLKTIHNWAERGEIRHFRTPGRHLRFRPNDLLSFLRRYGYPIPSELAPDKARVALLLNDATQEREASEVLQKSFEVENYGDPLRALLALGAHPPDALVLAIHLDTISTQSVIETLKAHENTRHIHLILVGEVSALRQIGADDAITAQINTGDHRGLSDTLEALLGIHRLKGVGAA